MSYLIEISCSQNTTVNVKTVWSSCKNVTLVIRIERQTKASLQFVLNFGIFMLLIMKKLLLLFVSYLSLSTTNAEVDKIVYYQPQQIHLAIGGKVSVLFI